VTPSTAPSGAPAPLEDPATAADPAAAWTALITRYCDGYSVPGAERSAVHPGADASGPGGAA
jgi:hypothetical protein